jgi:hypothetical protein
MDGRLTRRSAASERDALLCATVRRHGGQIRGFACGTMLLEIPNSLSYLHTLARRRMILLSEPATGPNIGTGLAAVRAVIIVRATTGS